MNWLGQHIVDFIARFRSDVYLEDLTTTTDTSVLVVDSNDKICKNTTTLGGDLTALVAGLGLSGTDLSGPIPTLFVDFTEFDLADVVEDGDQLIMLRLSDHLRITINQLASLYAGTGLTAASSIINVDASQPNITTLAGVTSIGTAGNSMNIVNNDPTFISTATTKPIVSILNTTDDEYGSSLNFHKLRMAGSIQAGEAADEIGKIKFNSLTNTTTPTEYANIIGSIDDATPDEASGQLDFNVASHDGELQPGLTIVGGNDEDVVDVTLGNTANSTVTVAGDLTVTGNINARMHYQFIGYTVGDGTNYEYATAMSDTKAPFEHDQTSNAAGTSLGGVGNISILIRMGGHVMPRASTLKKWTGSATYNGADDAYVSLFRWRPVDGSAVDVDPVLLHAATITGTPSGGNDVTQNFAETPSASVNAGDIIFTQIKTENSGKSVYFNSTLEVELGA